MSQGQGGSTSEWARERARALRKQLCKGRDPLLTNVRVYPDPTAEIEDVLARALDAAMAEEREAAIKIANEARRERENFMRHAREDAQTIIDLHGQLAAQQETIRCRGEALFALKSVAAYSHSLFDWSTRGFTEDELLAAIERAEAALKEQPTKEG